MTTGSEIKCLLFDLDGTLIELEMALFLPRYFQALGNHLSGLLEPVVLIPAILKSTEVMINNLDSSLTNKEVFEQDFFGRTGLEPSIVFPLFDSFYEEVFPQLAGTEVQNQSAQKAVEIALKNGFEIVLATNPVFPRKAIEERLKWGSFGQKEFTLITSYENMHFCKPQQQYYKEILTMLGRTGAECWMIGNDVGEDLVAGEIGINTFLVNDYLIPGPDHLIATKTGSIRDLPHFINCLNK